MKIANWQQLEQKSQELLKQWQQTRSLFYHRFYDTKSAGNFLPSQPSDFLVTYSGYTAYVELKYSDKTETLRQCFANNVKAHQTASAKLARRAGAGYWFLFYSSMTHQFELWDGLYCYERRLISRPLELEHRRLFSTLEYAWTSIITINLNREV